jgi:hypothetical protein
MGGIANDVKLQEQWRQLVSFPSYAYDVSSSAVGKWFVEKVAEEELKGPSFHLKTFSSYIV